MSYYPPQAFHFGVQFDVPGATDNDARFQDVSGINVELETETINEGAQNRFVQELPTRSKYSNLILKRGLLLDSGVIDWIRSAVEDFTILPVTVWVDILGEDHQPLQTYTFINAWPKRWSITDLNAADSQYVVEQIDLSYQYYLTS